MIIYAYVEEISQHRRSCKVTCNKSRHIQKVGSFRRIIAKAQNQRWDTLAELLNLGEEDAPTISYARVSSHDQKEDLQHQHILTLRNKK